MKLFGNIFECPADYRSAILEDQENWILVRHGSAQTLARAVEAYAELYPATVPQPCTIVIGRFATGFYGLRFPDPVPAYSFVNLIGWLHKPPGIRRVSGAMGWYRSPGTGTKYALYPDPANTWGDTLIGYNGRNQAVSVYLPEAALCEISRRIAAHQEPDLTQSRFQEQGRVTAILNADPSSGNPDFVITHTRDHNWS